MPKKPNHRRGKVIKHHPYCTCGERGRYHLESDAYYCNVGMVWLEAKCRRKGCEFCSVRPDVPPNDDCQNDPER